MDDFNKAFFDHFFDGMSADSPALAVIFMSAISFMLFCVFIKMAKEK